jgi:hypothetical protein
MPYRKPLTEEQKKRKQLKNKEYCLKNKELIKKKSAIYYTANKERIRKVQNKYLLLPGTKEKKKIYGKKYRKENAEYVAAWHKAHNKKNAVSISKQKQGYYIRKKDHIIKRTMAYAKKVSLANTKQGINFRIVRACRTRVWNLLKGNFKSASTMALVGCTGDELRKHLESKFEPWMTWENYGKWDIDHIIPCAKFDLECPVQQHACFHYSNLQPMEHIANIKKRDKIISGDITSPKM